MAITLYIAASLDGFVADDSGGVDWLESFEDTHDDGEPGGSYEDFFETVDCLVMGARTYEQVLGFGEWPYGDRPTVVVTHRSLPRANDSVSFYEGDLRPLLDRGVLVEHDHVWLVGGAALARQFLDEGLVDDIRLSVIPTLLGGGISLFGESGTERPLHLAGTTAYENGIVELHYEVHTREDMIRQEAGAEDATESPSR